MDLDVPAASSLGSGDFGRDRGVYYIDFTIAFSVAASTAVFERSGRESRASVSACHLAVVQRVQLPTSILATGFRDYIPIGGNDPALPLPPAIAQIVIVR